MPSEDNLQLRGYLLLNQQEHEQVTNRTRVTPAAAKARRLRLGNPKNLQNLNRTNKQAGRTFADLQSNLIWSLLNKGGAIREIYAVLNDEEITTANGGLIHPVQVTHKHKRSANPALR